MASFMIVLMTILAVLEIAMCGDDKNNYYLKIKGMEISYEDPEYSEVLQCDVQYTDDQIASWSFRWNVKKTIPDTCTTSVSGYEKQNNGWGESIYRVPDTPVNLFLKREKFYKNIQAAGNFPDLFPFQPNEYFVEDFKFNNTDCQLPANDWRFDFTLSIPDGITKKKPLLQMSAYLVAVYF